MIISPKADGLPFDAFAYLGDKTIAALHLENTGHFHQWMAIIFEKQRKDLAEAIADGLFERQPELNPNRQWMVVLGSGQFSTTGVHSGLMIDERPYDNTGAYLHKKAPKQYNEAKIAKEKDTYLKKYINTSGQTLDLNALRAVWETLVAVKVSNDYTVPDYSKSYAQFKTETGFAFPEELKVCYEIANAWYECNNDFQIFTPMEILKTWQEWKVIYDDPNWMLQDLKGNNYPDGRKSIGLYTNPYWVPFMSSGGPNYVAIDYAPNTKGTSGQIIAFGAEEGKIRVVAHNLLDFFTQVQQGEDVMNNGF